MNNCHMLIVLIGLSMTSADGVAKEIAMAQGLNLPELRRLRQRSRNIINPSKLV